MKYIISYLISTLLLLSSQVYALNDVSGVNISYFPRGFILSKDGNRAYVASGTCNISKKVDFAEITVIDLKSMSVVSKINIPVTDKGCLSKEIFLTADEKKLYVDYSKEIAIIDTTTYTISKVIKVSSNQHIKSAVISPDKSKLYYSVDTYFPNGNSFLVLDTKTDSFIAQFPNITQSFSYGIYGIAMSSDGNTIYEIPGAGYRELQPLVALNTNSMKSTVLGTLPENIGLLSEGLIVSKEDNIFYVSTEYQLFGNRVEDWYIYAIDKATMTPKEIYHAEHKVQAIGLSDNESQLYILDLRLYHKKITIINSITGQLIKDIPMINALTDAKIQTKAKASNIYFTTEPGNGQGSRFNVMSVN